MYFFHSDPLRRFDRDVPKTCTHKQHQHRDWLARLHRPAHVRLVSGSGGRRHTESRGLVNGEQRVGGRGAGWKTRPSPDRRGQISQCAPGGAVLSLKSTHLSTISFKTCPQAWPQNWKDHGCDYVATVLPVLHMSKHSPWVALQLSLFDTLSFLKCLRQ